MRRHKFCCRKNNCSITALTVLACALIILLSKIPGDDWFARGSYDDSLGVYIEKNNLNVFTFLMFTRWRLPRLFRKATANGKGITKISYDEVNPVDVDEAMTVRLALNRLDELDFRVELPPIYDRFDLVVFWDFFMTEGWDDVSQWETGKFCKCFVEMPESRAIAPILKRMDAMLTGMSVGRTRDCFRVLVFGSSDTRLSIVRDFVAEIHAKGYFDRIFYEAYDIELPYVWPMPMGLTDTYLLALPMGALEMSLRNVSLLNKHGVLAAWGAWWPKLDAKLKWRKSLDDWVSVTPWIERKMIPRSDWFGTLASHRFMLCPEGNGVVSPKFVEALMLLTIPIVPPLEYYKKMQKMGFPIVVVENWNEITEEALLAWWETISPSLQRSSWIHTSACWWELITSEAEMPHVTDALESCVPSQKTTKIAQPISR
jgi:hypothetical protein